MKESKENREKILEEIIREHRYQEKSPHTVVHFGNDEDDIKGWSLVPKGVPIVGLPERGIVADVGLLQRFKDAELPLYVYVKKDRKVLREEVNIDELINKLREAGEKIREYK